MSKPARQRKLMEIVSAEPVGSQDELRRLLGRAGFKVTQATLSRDIRELGLVKTAQGYAQPGEPQAAVPTPSIQHVLREFVTGMRAAQNLLVVKTRPGSAQPVALGLDAQQWEEIVGTVAGDDTILVITEDTKQCRQLEQRIRGLIE